MKPEDHKSKRLMGVFLLGCILLNYPVLSLFNRPAIVFGFPLLYAYMFAVWAGLIFLIYLGSRIRPRPGERRAPEGDGDA